MHIEKSFVSFAATPKDPLSAYPQTFDKIAEINGYLCGFICAGIENEGKLWLETLLGSLKMIDSDFPAKRSTLIDLYKSITYQLETETLCLRTIFSENTSPIIVRAYALRKWCTGFLTGLQQSGLIMPQIDALPDFSETLQRLNNISSLNLDNIDIREEDEAMFSEVMHYIGEAVLQIYRLLNFSQGKH